MVIYQVIDGELVDVTPAFSAVETDDGDYVFRSKTRQLGTYVVAEMPIAAAARAERPAEKPVKEAPARPGADRKGDPAFLREKITAPHFVPVRSGGRKREKQPRSARLLFFFGGVWIKVTNRLQTKFHKME